MELPAGLLGAALGTILLPSLAKSHSSGDTVAFSALLDWGLRLTFLLTLPAALALAVLGVPLLSTLFQHGAFTATDVLRTREALAAYSIGLTGLILVKVLAPGFYSRQDIRTPVKIALLTLALTQAMNLAFIGQLQHAGLALSIGLASCFNAFWLWRGLRTRNAYIPTKGWGKFFLKLLLALTVLLSVLWFGMGSEVRWFSLANSEKLPQLGGLVIAGLAAYFGTLWLVGFRFADFRQRASG
jgi:putative peptidoglycan lipid II flippase